MSSLPIINLGGAYDDSLDELWSLYQEILSEQPIVNNNPPLGEATKIGSADFSSVDQQQNLSINEEGIVENNGLRLMRNGTRNSRNRKRNSSNIENAAAGILSAGQSDEVASSSVAKKKLDHNAKERVRRMKVNAAFLALRELLPADSRRSKKRLKAPAIVDRALKYIPELEDEIEVLMSKKENMKSAVQKKKKINDNGINSQNQSCTVSINEVNEHEAIVQICMGTRENEHEQGSSFTNLLERVEDEGVYIASASTVYVCETKTCYHLHIQMNQISYGAGSIAELQETFLSWLR